MTAQTQPEALRLADRLESVAEDPMWSDHTEISKSLCENSAAELRRLHADNAQLRSRPALSDEQIEALPVWANFVGLFPEARKEIVRAIEAAQAAGEPT